MKLHKTKIHLKSGAILEFLMEEISVTTDTYGKVTKLSWKCVNGRILFICLSDISAVVIEK